MLALKGSTFNGRPTFANPTYLKKDQSQKPCLYEILYDTSDLANRFTPDREETLTLRQESRSKLNKDLVTSYDYTKQNSLYENFEPPSREYLEQLAHANEVQKKMWRKSFVKTKPHIVKNIGFLPTGKSISKSRQAYNKPKAVPISTRKPRRQANKSVATPYKKTVASDSTIQKSKIYFRMLYENTNCLTHPIHCWLWMHKAYDEKHQAAVYGDLVQGNIMIKRVYYIEGLNHNFFSVGQLCDADLEVAFQKSTCFMRDLQGNDLLTGNCGSDLYTISLQETSSPTPICFLAKASPTQAWLWHHRLSHLNFDTINLLSKKDIVNGLPKLKYVKDQLCSSCELGKAKRSTFMTKVVPSSKGRLNLLHIDLCGPMRIESINGKKYILVITIHTNRGTEFLNKTLHAYFKEEGIEHQTSTPRTPEQNGVVERRNHTLIEAARTMLSASKLPLFFWAEAIATACYTQNRSIIIPRHEKTPYHIINGRKPSIKHLYIFGSTCYITRDGENLDKMKEKGDSCILVGYSTQSKGYRVYNKRTRLIVTIRIFRSLYDVI
ncbi:retrovirus-related pol polyprotein from transposon TNT 1-94 [Tanacetum coccineum]